MGVYCYGELVEGFHVHDCGGRCLERFGVLDIAVYESRSSVNLLSSTLSLVDGEQSNTAMRVNQSKMLAREELCLRDWSIVA